MQNKTITVRHSGNIGDTLASIPAMREYYRKTGEKIILYLVIGQEGIYYEGATHPIKNEDGKNVMLNDKIYEMARPLFLHQEFIEDVRKWNGEDVTINMDIIRETFVGMPYTSINRWYFYVYPDLACDLSKKWLDVNISDKDFTKGKILINRTERYTNPIIDYSFLKEFEPYLMFAGLPHEHDLFCSKYGLNFPLLKIDNFLELAQAINQSLFFIGNQSSCFQIAEGSKHPRILETCYFATNVTPIGEDAFDFFSTEAVEWYVKYLFNKTTKL